MWRPDAAVRLVGLAAGLLVCLPILSRQVGRLPWVEIGLFGGLAALLRLRPVPLLRDETGAVILSHVPGESVLLLTFLRHGPDAAAMVSLVTNAISFGRIWRTWWKGERFLGSVSTIFYLPALAWLCGTLYYAFGGIPIHTPADCTRLFQEPLAVLVPLVGALVLCCEGVNRIYQGLGLRLSHGVSWREAFGNFQFGIFEHLENLGALLGLALWRTWGWGTLPFALLIMEALLLSARERIQRLEARRQAVLDPLTGLLSARGLSEAIQLRLRTRDKPFAVLFLDMDGFKQVNDRYGHGVGDMLLIQVGQALRSGLRPQDVVARRGGDEFVVVVTGSERSEAEWIAQRLRQVVQEAVSDDPRFTHVGFSLGIAAFPGDGTNEAALLHAADTAMYSDKRLRRAA